jgi:arsenite oxidase large subunit
MVKDAMSAVPYGNRDTVVNAIMEAIRAGGLFAVDVDIVPTKIGEACRRRGEHEPDPPQEA